MVSSCRVCATHRINKPEPLCPTVFPERPWQVVGTYLFYPQSVDYLLVAHYFPRCVEVVALRKHRQHQRLSGHLKLFLKEMESLRRSALTTDPHMIVKNTAILQGNLKVERYLLGKLKFNCNSMSYQATEGSAVK